ncbi:hypothetical protein AB5J55_22340 [Streptomyces sp. R11]|uniref:Uncharacterized protein n=1 Tax=Streptomyces sp. R11 TaxID=3238625 RepID=A0AB39N125_9ACTN
MRTRLGMIVLALVAILGGVTKAEAYSAPNKPHASYRVRVLAGTVHYPPCVELRRTREGRTWFADMVGDTYDEGRKRTVSQQIRYVREGCRAMTR